MQLCYAVQVQPPLSRLPIAAILCATARCPRIGLVVHTGGASPQALHATVSMYSAALDATSRISQTVQSAKIELGPSTPDSDGNGMEDAVALLEAPCTSFVLLHQYDDCESMEADTSVPAQGDEATPLITMLYRPPGVQVCVQLQLEPAPVAMHCLQSEWLLASITADRCSEG